MQWLVTVGLMCLKNISPVKTVPPPPPTQPGAPPAASSLFKFGEAASSARLCDIYMFGTFQHEWLWWHASSTSRIWEPFRKAKGPEELSGDMDLMQGTVSRHRRRSCSTYDDRTGRFEDFLKMRLSTVEDQTRWTWKAQ